ncbi:MAG: hypothetical protein J0M12_02650 [Deltaproteobacteria bacterium]|nr:hypothetical protein [Deltaproteobacteria bacterium]
MDSSSTSQTHTWVQAFGKADGALCAALDQRIKARLAAKEFRADEVEYVKQANFSPIQGDLKVSESELNTLRRLCQAWEIELRPGKITSHRPLVGPLIVAAKKLVFPIIQVFLKDLVKQQKDFNSSAISLMGALLSERDKR